MGGYGSGKRWDAKLTTDDYLRLDARELQRYGMLARRYQFLLAWKRNGERTASINIEPENDRLNLSYTTRSGGGEPTLQRYPVALERTPCHYGGERVWFLCPARGCGRRVAVLYGGTIFACRGCHNLAYGSQHESPGDRADRRAWKIQQRCGGWGCLLDSVVRPKGMHKRTFKRLERAYNHACHTSEDSFVRRFGVSPHSVMS